MRPRLPLLLLVLVLAQLVLVVAPASAGDVVSVKGVPFYPMHSAICAISSLEMVLSFYGYNYTSSLLLQLSLWDYGFWYMKEYHFGFAGGIGPIDAMARAARLLGFNITIYNYTRFEDAVEKLREILGRGHPAIIQLAAHTVVGVGVDPERKLIYIHDPSGGICSWRAVVELRALGLEEQASRLYQALLNMSRPPRFGAYYAVPFDVMKMIWRMWDGRYVVIEVTPREAQEGADEPRLGQAAA